MNNASKSPLHISRSTMRARLAQIVIATIISPLISFIPSVLAPSLISQAKAEVPGSISITRTGVDPYGGYTGNDYINFNFPAGRGLNDARSFTIETWAYLGNSNSYGTVSLTAGDAGASKNEYWKIRRSGFLINPSTGTWFAEGAGTAYCNPTTLTNAIPMGQWANLAYQRSIISGTATDSIYINGILSGSCVVGTSNINNDTVRIGTTANYNGTNTSYFGPTRVIDGEAIYTSNFTPSTSFGSYVGNSSGTGTTILNLAPTSTVPLTYAETPPYAPTLTYGAYYLFNGTYYTTTPTYGTSTMSPPFYTSRTLSIDSGSFSSSYSLGSTGPTISATASGGTGTKSYSTTTSSVCTIASTGLVTLVSAGTCSITAQIANDGTYAASTSAPISFSIIKAVPTLSLALPQNATTAIYGTAISITAIISTPGSVTFKYGGTAITGCSPVASSTSGTYSATCSWTPGVLGTAALTADFVPTSSNYNSLSGAASLSINVTGSTVATLSALALSSGTLTPTFASGTTSYTASVANSVASGYTVTPTKSDSNASTVQYIGSSGTTVFSGALAVGSNVIRTVVTAQDGTTTKTYTVTVTRAGSADANLSALTLSTGTLSPTFTSATTSYTASVANSVASGYTVTPTKSESNATIVQYIGSSGTTAFTGDLAVGANVIRTVVTAQDGATTKTYTVTVTRSASADATLSNLALSSGTLSPTFTSATTSYTASVANSVTSITVTPTLTQANATITVNGTSVASGSASGAISLSVGSNAINVIVTAQDGTTTKTYAVTVTRAASADATLSNLALSSGTLSPTFASGTTSYTASVANSVASGYTVTPTKSDSNESTVQYLGSSGTTAFTGDLAVGSNVIRTIVTAQDGTTTKTYTVTVTRLSNDATLSALTFSSGTLSPSFASSTNRYSISVATNVSSLTVTPTRNQINATITVNGTLVNSGTSSGAISLNVGSNTINVVVTPQDGTQNTYEISVTRSAPTITYYQNNCYPGPLVGGACPGTTPSISSTATCSYGSSYTVLGSGANTQSTPTQSPQGNAVTYTFNGWNTQKTGNGTKYLPGDIVNCTSDLALYVQWSDFKINLNTGYGGPTIDSIPVDPYFYTPTLTIPSRANWAFNGWSRIWGPITGIPTYVTTPFRANASPSGSEKNGPSTQDSDFTLCAAWTNSIAFNTQGATTIPVEIRCPEGYVTGSSVEIPSATPLKTNAVFGGWYTAANGGGTKVIPGSYTPAAPYGIQTLFAYWLGVKYDPTFGVPTRTAGGFVVSTTNFNASFVWDSETVVSGSGNVTMAMVNGQVQLTVTGIAPGALATISLRTSQQGYVDGTGFVTGQALAAGLKPIISNIITSTSGFQASVNYNADYQWSVSSTTGSAAINSLGQISVVNVDPSTQVTLTVNTSRFGYASGTESATATTLQRLQVIYSGNGATGGSAPTDSKQYLSNETATVLNNTGQSPLTILGNNFEGWTLDSNGNGRIYKSGDTLQLASASVTLYAKWSLISYYVTYRSDGTTTSGVVPVDLDSQGNRSKYTIGQNAPVYGNTGNLARTGYSFAGWGLSATDTTTAYQSGQSYAVGASNIDFWARWSPNTYTVTFDANGATGSPSKANDTYTTAGTPVTLASVNSMQKTGYSFVGWGISPVSATISDSYTMTSDVRLYAQWVLANYSVCYLAGTNGVGTPPTQANVNFGSSFTVAAASGLSSNDGQYTYAFVSWNDGTRTYAPGQNYVVGASAVTFTAQWTRIYNVQYSFNGGSVLSQILDQQKVSGDTITITSTTPTRGGYTFLNWVDQAGETTTANSTYTVRDNHYLLYAQWEAVSYTVTYDGNGGNTSPTEPNHTVGQIFTVAGAPSKTGYNFDYWSDGVNRFNAGTSYQVGTSNVILQAHWTAQVYKISYEFNGGFGNSISDTSYTFNSPAVTLPATGISRTDFNLSGWATSASALSGVTTFTPSGDITLYAVWVSSVYRLNFDGAGGYSDSATAKVAIGQSLILPSATRSNYTLQGWSTQQSGGGNVAGGASYTPATSGTLYAQWTLQVFTVTYDGNGGTAAKTSDSMTFGSLSPITLPTASRRSYNFKGWYSAPTGGYLIGISAANFSPTSSLTAYAQWVQTSLNGMGAATQIAQMTVQAGTDSSFTSGSNGSTATVNYVADSLPVGTLITAYLENSTSRVASLLTNRSSPVLSLIIAWVAPDGTVPETEVGKPITMTVSNPSIKAGSKVYGLLGNKTDVLGTATIDGQVQVSISEDPAVVVAIVAPDAPTNVNATENDATTAFISWNAPAVNGGSEITGYTATSSGGLSCTSLTTSCLITGLTSGINYTFTVVATNVIGSSVVSSSSQSLTMSGNQNGGGGGSGGGGAGGGGGSGGGGGGGSVSISQNVAPTVAATTTPLKVDDSAELQAAQAAAAAELQAARNKAEVDAKAVSDAAAMAKAVSDAKAAAEAKALSDAALAAELAAQKIVPNVTLYSISPKLTLSAFDLVYLKKYLSTLKKTATVTCIGYTYTQKLSLAKATVLAKKQASAVCAIVKKTRPTLKIAIQIRPSKSAPKAAAGAQWVAISYRVDGYQLKK